MYIKIIINNGKFGITIDAKGTSAKVFTTKSS